MAAAQAAMKNRGVRAALGSGGVKVFAEALTFSPSIISQAGEQGADSMMAIAGCRSGGAENIFLVPFFLPGKGAVRGIGAIFSAAQACLGWPPKGFYFFA